MAGRPSPASSSTVPPEWTDVVAGGTLASHGLLFAVWAIVQRARAGNVLRNADNTALSFAQIADRVGRPQKEVAGLMGDLIRTGFIVRDRTSGFYVLPHVQRLPPKVTKNRYGKAGSPAAMRIAARYDAVCFSINRWTYDDTAAARSRGPKNIDLWLKEGQTEEDMILAADHCAETLTPNDRPRKVGNFYGRETPYFFGFLGEEWEARKKDETPNEPTFAISQERAKEIFES